MFHISFLCFLFSVDGLCRMFLLQGDEIFLLQGDEIHVVYCYETIYEGRRYTSLSRMRKCANVRSVDDEVEVRGG